MEGKKVLGETDQREQNRGDEKYSKKSEEKETKE